MSCLTHGDTQLSVSDKRSHKQRQHKQKKTHFNWKFPSVLPAMLPHPLHPWWLLAPLGSATICCSGNPITPRKLRHIQQMTQQGGGSRGFLCSTGNTQVYILCPLKMRQVGDNTVRMKNQRQFITIILITIILILKKHSGRLHQQRAVHECSEQNPLSHQSRCQLLTASAGGLLSSRLFLCHLCD